MPSLRLPRLIRRSSDRPTLKERAAALKHRLARIARRPDVTDPSRRVIVAGSLAAAIPLPALAAPALAAAGPAGAHPDAELLDLSAALVRAKEAEAAAETAYRAADRIVDAVLVQCPDVLRVHRWEYEIVNPFARRSPFPDTRFRWVPPVEEGVDDPHWSHQAWTGALLRKVIERAVPMLGRGGQTPHHVRRWKAMLPIADRFDARAEAVEAATDHVRLSAEREAARAVCKGLRAEIAGKVATTPEGMAALVLIVGGYCWKDTGGAWPNLLRSAANVSGVALADLEHESASTRGN